MGGSWCPRAGQINACHRAQPMLQRPPWPHSAPTPHQYNIQQNWVACAAGVVVASIFGAYCRHVFFMLCRGHSSAMLEAGDTTPPVFNVPCECWPRFAPSGILLASRVGTQPTFYFHTRRDVRACGKSQVKLEHITMRRYVSHVFVQMLCIISASLQNYVGPAQFAPTQVRHP